MTSHALPSPPEPSPSPPIGPDVLFRSVSADVTNFRHYVAPFPNWHVLVPNLRFFHQHGVQGVFEEGTYGTSGGRAPPPSHPIL